MVETLHLTGNEVFDHSLYKCVMKLRQTAPTSMISMYLGDHNSRSGMKSDFPQNITASELEFQRIRYLTKPECTQKPQWQILLVGKPPQN
nr:hypothetical protein HmN_000552000 [Hymenolepis microstoma]